MDDPRKIKWDIFVCILLLFCVFVIPWRLAFANDDNEKAALTWDIIYYTMDICFLFDIVFSFFTAVP